MKLLIVESPNKIAKLKHILGNGWQVCASYGHIEDLPAKEIGIDFETLQMKYVPIPDKRKNINFIKSASKNADAVYLATDPDREGEAIAWHVAKYIPKNKPAYRVTFNAITREEVLRGVNAPRKIDANLVFAQQARRAIDRIIGYVLSPAASRATSKPLSVGRVQSPAVSIIANRNKEIADFKPSPYWVIEALVNTHCYNGNSFKAVHPETYKEQARAQGVYTKCGGSFKVASVKTSRTQASPSAPFITASLQKAAFARFKYSPAKTMSVAQKLYEAGAVTYIRTDSPWISDDGLKVARGFVNQEFGNDYYKQRNFQAKGLAQEAHECIRPTSGDVPKGLAEDEHNLLRLIRERFFASQMKEAEFDKTVVQLDNNGVPFMAQGKKLLFDGFLKMTGIDEETKNELLPPVKEGMVLSGKAELVTKKTQPPKKYNDASLIDTLEKHGIGRPSTYASILKTIFDRGYVTKEAHAMAHTPTADMMLNYLKVNHNWLLDLNYTKNLEEKLDLIAESKVRKEIVIREVLEHTQAYTKNQTNAPAPRR